MIRIRITHDDRAARAFLARVEGELRRPRALNDRLARALAARLQAHFLERDAEPNQMGAEKSGFWAGVRAGTKVGTVDDAGATVQVGADTFFRIHLLGGVVRPRAGKKWLTIPLIPEARGLRVRDYEKESGHKLFRPAGMRVLMERSKEGDRSTLTRSGRRVFHLGAGTRVRPVYALAERAEIKPDPRALPPEAELTAALQEAADAWAERETRKGDPMA